MGVPCAVLAPPHLGDTPPKLLCAPLEFISHPDSPSLLSLQFTT